jgi:[ribosomal protein S18]-alanine N-acetyltransferase
MTRQLRPVTADDLAALAALHRACFPDDRWDERALAELLAISGASGHLIEDLVTRERLGFILDLILAGEAEIFTLCTAPAARRQGIARALIEHLFARARRASARSVGLEVAADNIAARAVYEQCGFMQAGRRRDYYRRGAASVDALLLRRVLQT